MDLDREISLGSLKALFKRSGKAAASASKGPLKTEINFVLKEDKSSMSLKAIPAVIIVVVAAAVIGKLAVADRYIALSNRQDEAAGIEREIDDALSVIEESGELTEQYYHYTWSGMSDAEREQLKRSDVFDLVSFISSQGVTIQSLSVTSNELSINVSADSLKDISALAQQIETRELVSSVNVSTARTNTDKGESKSGKVGASVIVYLTGSGRQGE